MKLNNLMKLFIITILMYNRRILSNFIFSLDIKGILYPNTNDFSGTCAEQIIFLRWRLTKICVKISSFVMIRQEIFKKTNDEPICLFDLPVIHLDLNQTKNKINDKSYSNIIYHSLIAKFSKNLTFCIHIFGMFQFNNDCFADSSYYHCYNKKFPERSKTIIEVPDRILPNSLLIRISFICTSNFFGPRCNQCKYSKNSKLCMKNSSQGCSNGHIRVKTEYGYKTCISLDTLKTELKFV